MRSKYSSLLPQLRSRKDLDDLIGELLGELGISHLFVRGSPPRGPRKHERVGLLGARISKGGQIERVLDGGPLGAVPEGAFLHEIDGTFLGSTSNVYEHLLGKAGQIVRLTIRTENGLHELAVRAIADESPLLYANWVDSNRQRVSEATCGEVGYIHIPDFNVMGHGAFARQFYPQVRKRAMIIDLRSNPGGFHDHLVIEKLAQRVVGGTQYRQGGSMFGTALRAHLICIIDQQVDSSADGFAWEFRARGLGELVGKRTCGGFFGVRSDKAFIDGGSVTIPGSTRWNVRSGWPPENIGVAPDIEVDLTPADRTRDTDSQLEASIRAALQALERDEMDPPTLPPLPVHKSS